MRTNKSKKPRHWTKSVLALLSEYNEALKFLDLSPHPIARYAVAGKTHADYFRYLEVDGIPTKDYMLLAINSSNYEGN